MIPPSVLNQMGLSNEQFEDWVWTKEAINARIPLMAANSRQIGTALLALRDLPNLKSSPAYPDIASIELNLEGLGEIEHELTQLKMAYQDWTERSAPSCVVTHKIDYEQPCWKVLEARKHKYEEAKRPLEIAKNELFKQSPVLSHKLLQPLITKQSIKRPFTINGEVLDASPSGSAKKDSAEFYAVLQNALSDIQLTVDQRRSEYSRIVLDDKRLGEMIKNDSRKGSGALARENYKEHVDAATYDMELLDELLVSVDPSKIKGLEHLGGVTCRLEARKFTGKAMAEVRSLAFNTLVTVATFGAGAFFVAGKGLTTLGLAVRAAPLIASEALLLGVGFNDLAVKGEECRKLKALAMSDVPKTADGKDTLTALRDCDKAYSQQVVVTALGTALSGVGWYSTYKAAAKNPLLMAEKTTARDTSSELSKEVLETSAIKTGQQKEASVVKEVAAPPAAKKAPYNGPELAKTAVSSPHSLSPEEIERALIYSRVEASEKAKTFKTQYDISSLIMAEDDPAELEKLVSKMFKGNAKHIAQGGMRDIFKVTFQNGKVKILKVPRFHELMKNEYFANPKSWQILAKLEIDKAKKLMKIDPKRWKFVSINQGSAADQEIGVIWNDGFLEGPLLSDYRQQHLSAKLIDNPRTNQKVVKFSDPTNENPDLKMWETMEEKVDKSPEYQPIRELHDKAMKDIAELYDDPILRRGRPQMVSTSVITGEKKEVYVDFNAFTNAKPTPKRSWWGWGKLLDPAKCLGPRLKIVVKDGVSYCIDSLKLKVVWIEP